MGEVRLGNAKSHIFIKNTKRVAKTLKNLKILKYKAKIGIFSAIKSTKRVSLNKT